ncbi:hypothetical protein ACFQV2_01195 [Actinokineospora soli]|uniref:Uncharacterized protein n=1 Tax=Actinokineospora soli TaxID=1048753 RepID=A0ABW2TI23_9PSEU
MPQPPPLPQRPQRPRPRLEHGEQAGRARPPRRAFRTRRGNPDTIAAAEAWLQAAQANRAAVDAAHPVPQTGGHDTAPTNNTPDTPTAAQDDQQGTETRVPGRTGGIGTINATGSVTVIDGNTGETLRYTAGPGGDTTGGGITVTDGQVWVNNRRVR